MAKAAIRIGKKWKGNGYSKEALKPMTDFIFNNTEIKRLCTDVDIRNVVSIKLLKSCRYKKEEFIRQWKMVHIWCDYYIYAKLNTDY